MRDRCSRGACGRTPFWLLGAAVGLTQGDARWGGSALRAPLRSLVLKAYLCLSPLSPVHYLGMLLKKTRLVNEQAALRRACRARSDL